MEMSWEARLQRQPGGKAPTDDLDGEFIAAMLRLDVPFDRDAWRSETLLQFQNIARPAKVKRRGRG